MKKYGAQYEFDWRLLAAQMFQESRFDPNARSWAGALGLMQVMTASGKSCGRPGQLSPRVNIKTLYVTSPQSAKPRKWPPDTCGMAFEKLILKSDRWRWP